MGCGVRTVLHFTDGKLRLTMGKEGHSQINRKRRDGATNLDVRILVP